MENNLLLPVLVGLILLVAVIVPVHADDAEEYVNAENFARDGSVDFLGVQIFDSKPSYQKSAQDYMDEGNYWKGRCEHFSRLYDQRLLAYVQKYHPQWAFGYQNPTAEMRVTVQNVGLHKDDPLAAQYWQSMKTSCDKAWNNYNTAASMTEENGYLQQAKIYDGAAGMFDALGQKKDAAEARDEAAFARGRERLKSGSDCLIVTATFGSPMAGEVQLVRDFRDETVKQNYLGSRYVTALNAVYYSFSPAVARSIDENPSVKPVMRLVLAPLIGIVLLSQAMYSLMSFSPGIATVVFIVSGGALVGLVYILPVMLSALWVTGKKRWHVPGPGSLKPLVFVWAGLLATLVISAVLKIDLIAVLSSGLLFACTVFLTAGAVALYLSGYLRIRPAGRNE
jgi:hypothetical protein